MFSLQEGTSVYPCECISIENTFPVQHEIGVASQHRLTSTWVHISKVIKFSTSLSMMSTATSVNTEILKDEIKLHSATWSLVHVCQWFYISPHMFIKHLSSMNWIKQWNRWGHVVEEAQRQRPQLTSSTTVMTEEPASSAAHQPSDVSPAHQETSPCSQPDWHHFKGEAITDFFFFFAAFWTWHQSDLWLNLRCLKYERWRLAIILQLSHIHTGWNAFRQKSQGRKAEENPIWEELSVFNQMYR